MHSYHRARKPWAIRRLKVQRYRSWMSDPRRRRDYQSRGWADKFGRTRPTILRPGRFFYCQDCGRRIAPDQMVLEWHDTFSWTSKDNGYVSCLDCATASGFDVWTSERILNQRSVRDCVNAGMTHYM